MLPIVLMMLVILVLAAAVVLYVAFPHRGEDLPAVPWVGTALRKSVDAMPSLSEEDADARR
ncbi:hypothetical protein [Nocardioides jensenii]|uniref:hypothetical protein n=1 Tax=Nocardioides jensenii TaxID=1843 RepID=UPI00082F4003|nr:hypothetical protein [Nocardioides jensenii]